MENHIWRAHDGLAAPLPHPLHLSAAAFVDGGFGTAEKKKIKRRRNRCFT